MDPQMESAMQAPAGPVMFMNLIFLALAILGLVAGWRILSKAGKPGWGILIPIWNIILFLQVAGKPAWWIVLLFIPFVNIIVGILATVGLAKNFGKGIGFAIGLILLGPIFYLILAFSDARYVGEGSTAA